MISQLSIPPSREKKEDRKLLLPVGGFGQSFFPFFQRENMEGADPLSLGEGGEGSEGGKMPGAFFLPGKEEKEKKKKDYGKKKIFGWVSHDFHSPFVLQVKKGRSLEEGGGKGGELKTSIF